MDKAQSLKTFTSKNQAELVQNARPDLLDHFRLINRKGGVARQDNAICYAAFNRFKHKQWGLGGEAGIGFKADAMLVWHVTPNNDAIFRKYIKWVVDRSPYRAAFKDHMAHRVFKEPTVIHTKYDPRFVIGAAMCIRYRREMPELVKMWYKFSQYMSEDLAWVFAHMFGPYDKKAFTVFNQAGGHNLYDNGCSKDGLKAFLTHTPCVDITKDSVRNDNYTYKGLWDIWGCKGPKIELPKPDTIRKISGWNPAMEQKIEVYSYDKLEKFVQEFVAINNLDEAYAE